MTEGPIELRSDRLLVEYSRPGSLYRRTRFDWTGFITQVTLDGRHTFCTAESFKPGQGTGGCGLCNEFGNEKPIGWADCRPGEPFPKLGIGLLSRDAGEGYSYLRDYEIVQPFPVELEAGPDRLAVLSGPIDCRGYAARLKKVIRAEGNWLSIDYELENTGSLAIDTHEYAHNFIAIDRQPLGPDYRLRLPYPIRRQKIAAAYRKFLPPLVRKVVPSFITDRLIEALLQRGVRALSIQDNEVRFPSTPKGWFYFRTSGAQLCQEAQWEVRLRSSGAGLREYDDFTPARVAVWGEAHVVSAEVFIDILLQPGEVKTWSRRYEFV